MKNKLVIVSIVLSFFVLGHTAEGVTSLYDLESSPYAANVANKPGDLLTVIVMEETKTEDSGTKDSNKKNEMKFELGKFFFPHFKANLGFDDKISDGDTPGLNLNAENKYSADAKNNSEHSVETKFQVRIVEEVFSGQFVIRGQRLVVIEGNNKLISLSGIIQGEDIKDDNSIESHLIADAVIEIDGQIVTKELKPGYIASILTKLFF